MSFVAAIDANKQKLQWSRSILSLASISDHIKFIISLSSVSLSAVNSARTAHAEVIFKNAFFYEYTVDFTDILPEGYQEADSDSNTEALYSFLVLSKHLATLFRNFDAKDLDYVCFKIYWDKNASITMKYKLLIEIKTKKLIIKKYQTNYQPVIRNRVNIASIYKKQLYEHEQDKSNEDTRINYIMIEQSTPKQFLDMIPSNTEDFKIDVKNEKILFSGYTKQILKDREYLKQPMSMTITLSLDELINSNLSTINTSDEPLKRTINFRLKEFKNFINLIATFNATSDKENELNPELDEHFEIFFRNPGDPVLFELENPNITIQYIQFTSEETAPEGGTNLVPKALRKKDGLILQEHVVEKIQNYDIVEGNNGSQRDRFPLHTQPRPINNSRPTGRISVNKHSNTMKTPEPYQPSQHASSAGATQDEFVTYGRDFSPEVSHKRQKTAVGQRKILNGDETDYSSEEETPGPQGEMEFGPTQVGVKPKSVFD